MRRPGFEPGNSYETRPCPCRVSSETSFLEASQEKVSEPLEYFRVVLPEAPAQATLSTYLGIAAGQSQGVSTEITNYDSFDKCYVLN